MTARGPVVAAALAAAGLAATPAQAAAPPAGAKITGTTSQGQKVTGRVTSDGKGLQLEFAETFKCGDGSRFRLRASYQKQRPTIKADGSVDYTKTYRNRTGLPEFPGTYDNRQRITGAFSATGKTFTGKSVASLSKPGRTCRSSITLKLKAG